MPGLSSALDESAVGVGRFQEGRDGRLAATTIQLPPDDLREIESAASKITAHADRYSGAAQRMIIC